MNPAHRSDEIFRQEVTKAFSFLEKDEGFKVVEAGNEQRFAVTYESKRLVLDIYLERYHELGVSIRRKGKRVDQERPLDVYEVMKMVNPDDHFPAPYMVPSSLEVKEGLNFLAQKLKQYKNEVLDADDATFEGYFKKRNEKFKKHVKEEQTKNLRREVESAFEKKDYHKAVELYELIKDDLTELDQKRWQYAQKQLKGK